VDTQEHKIALSIKHMSERKEKAEVEEYMGAQKKATSSLGDLLKGAFDSSDND
jgi:small subunit ribosomal protein S1